MNIRFKSLSYVIIIIIIIIIGGGGGGTSSSDIWKFSEIGTLTLTCLSTTG
jgi:hypothetical protein